MSAGVAVSAAAVGGAVGSAASQLVGKGLGVVDDFSWQQVALGGLGAGVTAGLGAAAGVGGVFKAGQDASYNTMRLMGNGMVRSAANYATNYMGSKALGMDASFSWTNLAASVGGSAFSTGLAQNLPTAFQGVVGDTLTGFAGAAASSALRGESFGDNAGAFMVDAFGNAVGNMISRQMSLPTVNPNITAKKLAGEAGIEFGHNVSTVGGVGPNATEEELMAYIAAVRKNADILDLKEGSIFDPAMLARVRSSNVHEQFWPGPSVPIIDDPDLVKSLKLRETGGNSQESSYIYMVNDNQNVADAMAAFVLQMGEYDDLGVSQGLQLILSGEKYVDISGVVNNSIAAVANDYAATFGYNFYEMAKKEGNGFSLSKGAYNIADGVLSTWYSAFDAKLPTFMQGQALGEVAMSVFGAAGGVNNFLTKRLNIAGKASARTIFDGYDPSTKFYPQYKNRSDAYTTRRNLNQLGNMIYPRASCATTCGSMVADTLDISVSADKLSSALRSKFKSDGSGLQLADVAIALRQHDISARPIAAPGRVKMHQLERAISEGHPAIVGLDIGVRANGTKVGHAVVLDQIIRPAGQSRLFKVRDPAFGKSYVYTEENFKFLWGNRGLTTKPR
ncbi:hypothetical protein K6Y31_20155 [Motilimonas cestriensis]|uniref:Peptidase C39 domain-containing protein n=1 Tax=Motilimonas cestriensis TaxID=2742685 RepID=A0ABS8WDH1_9GAMM|nr:hypothetical protein [Motilimonas cestriensis]MCE2597091.1 hypothetical protein [Motilimonas cestriensis]